MRRLPARSLVGLTVLPLAAASGLAAPEGEPRVIDPGLPPADAIVLFDGKDLSQWKNDDGGGPAKWGVKDGAAVANSTGDISAKRGFGDCQITRAAASKSGRAKSRFLMGAVLTGCAFKLPQGRS
jgi:Domain of Unknown Function (DUF1080)